MYLVPKSNNTVFNIQIGLGTYNPIMDYNKRSGILTGKLIHYIPIR